MITRLIAILICGIMALQYVPVTFNGKTVIIDISCCKDLMDCCSSGAQACSMHRDHGDTGSYTSCHASADMSVYIFMVSKGVFHEATFTSTLVPKTHFIHFDDYLSPQNPVDLLLKPPQPLLLG